MRIESLFNESDKAGVFKGFVDGGMEFHADLVLPYNSTINNRPMHGMFVLIQLDTPDEAVLGRITSMVSDGRLASGSGEDYNIRALTSGYSVPETLKQEFLKYRVNVRVLGGLRLEKGKVVFVPSFRRIPSVGAAVCFPSDEVLRALAHSDSSGTEIGLYALGEYIYAGDKAKEYGLTEPWMNIQSPEIPVRFDVNAMVARRTFVFARAGFGKSNLNKLLFSQLYKTTPMKRKGDREVPVGTVIFDRDGEYFWPDDNGRPGLCDVEELADNLVVFTNRQAPNDYYGSFVAGKVGLDLRELPASTVISIAVSQERQEQQNVRKLKWLRRDKWRELIDLVHRDGHLVDPATVKALLGISDSGDAEASAAIANINNVVKMLHDPRSRFMFMLRKALSEGKLCIVDMSQYGSDTALILSGLVLNEIFVYNQSQFTEKDSKAIPTIAVLEEAQSVLTPGKNATTPFISWVKEGRKYDLGALMITQQPGSISTDILSQGDNWFVFHLLSDKDLQDVRHANAHFSNDLLSSLLNEPIVGQGVFWSSVKTGDDALRPYPLPLRIFSFEHVVKIRNKGKEGLSGSRYVPMLKKSADKTLPHEKEATAGESTEESPCTMSESVACMVAEKLRGDPDLEMPVPWARVSQYSQKVLNLEYGDLNLDAFPLMPTILKCLYGEEDLDWTKETVVRSDGSSYKKIVKVRNDQRASQRDLPVLRNVSPRLP